MATKAGGWGGRGHWQAPTLSGLPQGEEAPTWAREYEFQRQEDPAGEGGLGARKGEVALG